MTLRVTISNFFEKCVAIILSLFYGFLVSIYALFCIIKNRSKYFQIKPRNSPNCLNDSTLGTHQFIQLKDIKLHYVSNGDKDKQLMIFIHGFPEFWYSWRYQIKEFTKDYYVVAYDQRGYGDSDKPKGVRNYTIDKLSEDLKDIVLGLEKDNIILVAHDWGGFVAWDFAARYAELVDKLIIFNSPHPLRYQQFVKTNFKQFLRSWYLFFFNVPKLPEMVLKSNDLQLLENTFKSSDGKMLCSTEEVEAYKYMLSKPYGLTAPLNYYRAIVRKYPFDPPKSFQIKPPTLIIWGKNDIALSYELAEAQEFCDNLTVKYIENCSHWSQIEHPFIANQYMREFLTKE